MPIIPSIRYNYVCTYRFTADRPVAPRFADMFVVRVLLITLQLVGWSASQAPGDADTFCTVDLVSQHPVYPNNIRVLMDSADYQNLIRENTSPDPVWQTVDVDGIDDPVIRVNVS